MLSNFSTNYGNKILKTTTYKLDIDRIWGEISTLFLKQYGVISVDVLYLSEFQEKNIYRMMSRGGFI